MCILPVERAISGQSDPARMLYVCQCASVRPVHTYVHAKSNRVTELRMKASLFSDRQGKTILCIDHGSKHARVLFWHINKIVCTESRNNILKIDIDIR
jgi:hypothetical protein